MCSETGEAVGTTWEHAQLEFQKFLKIRITLMAQYRLLTKGNMDFYSISDSEGYHIIYSTFDKKSTYTLKHNEYPRPTPQMVKRA